MRTRSKFNLENIHISSLLYTRKNTKNYKPISNKTTSNIDLKVKSEKAAIVKKEVKEDLTYLIIDTESFSLNSDNKNDQLPVQISWQIFKGKELKPNSEKRMFYVAEMWLKSQYIDVINKGSYFTKKTKEKHEKYMEFKDYPILGAKKIMEILQNDLLNCDYICAFNVEWDRDSLQNLIDALKLDIVNPFVSAKKSLDIMYYFYITFEKELIKRGIETEIINTSGRKIDQRKKGICCASFMLEFLSNNNDIDEEEKLEQTHLADDDVEMEKYLLHQAFKTNKLNMETFDKLELNDPIYKMIQKKSQEMYRNVLYILLKVDCNEICHKCRCEVPKNTIVYRHRYIRERFICQCCSRNFKGNLLP